MSSFSQLIQCIFLESLHEKMVHKYPLNANSLQSTCEVQLRPFLGGGGN